MQSLPEKNSKSSVIRNTAMNIDPEYKKLAIKGFIKLAVFLVLIFVAAGRFDYWQGWVLSGVILMYSVAAFFLFAGAPDLARERMKPGRDTLGGFCCIWHCPWF